MLDLTSLEIKYLEVKMLDGKVIHIKKPTQKMFNFIIKVNVLKAEEQAKKIDELVSLIVSNNKEDEVYSLDDISKYDLEIKEALLNAFSEFTKEVMSNPN